MSTLKAGPELDAQVAKEVMGLKLQWDKDTRCPDCGGEMRYCGGRAWCYNEREWKYSQYKDYSTDWSAAGEVLEKLGSDGWLVSIDCNTDGGICWVTEDVGDGEDAPTPRGGRGEVDTPAETPLAICLAALEAVRKAKPAP